MRLRMLIVCVWLPIWISAAARIVTLQQDTVISAGWTIASGDTVELQMAGRNICFSGSQGFLVSGMLSVYGNTERIENSGSSISELVRIAGGTLEINGATWESQNSTNGLIVQQAGALHIRGGEFLPDGELITATADTLSITDGRFEAGISAESWLQVAPTMRVGLRGGRYVYDPRAYGLEADYGYEVYAYRYKNNPIEYYYIAAAHKDTTRLDTMRFCWEADTIWQGQHITEAGVYYDTLHNQRGGDSLLILPVVVEECIDSIDVVVEESLSVCDSVYWRNRWLYATGVYCDTVAIDAYKDSLIYLDLTVYPSWREDIEKRTYIRYVWRGRELTESGEYYDSLQTVAFGCDSIYHLSLIIDQVTNIYDTVHICAGESYSWYGEELYRDSVYMHSAGDVCYVLRLVIDPLLADSVPAYSLHGHRMLVLDHTSLAAQGYDFPVDSVRWYRIVGRMDDARYPETGDDEQVGQGDCYTGDGSPLVGDYYALVHVEQAERCRLPLRTVVLHQPAAAAPARIALHPAVVLAGEEVTIEGLDETQEYTIRVLSTRGAQTQIVRVKSCTNYSLKTSGMAGCYVVQVVSDNQQVSMRYIVQ